MATLSSEATAPARSDTESKPARQSLPDELRAIALVGIVVVNAPFIALGLDGFSGSNLGDTLDRIVAFTVTVLAEGKFYLLFSFLFGYSANFIVRAGAANGRRRWRRRLLILAAIGLAHAVFFFIGDILMAYALLGVGLIPLFGRTDRTVLITGATVAVIGALWVGLLVVASFEYPESANTGGELFPDYDPAMAEGGFLAAAEARLSALPVVQLILGSIQWPLAFGAFCLGLVAGRRGFLADPIGDRARFRRMALLGVGVGLPIQVGATLLAFSSGGPDQSGPSFAGLAIAIFTAPILSAGYIGLLGLASSRPSSLLKPLRQAGRASLSIYIGESIVLSTIFCGWGLGLFGDLGALAITVLAIATWVLLVIAMNLWLGRFRQGPLETVVTRFSTPRR
ncbi:MAG: DUF418 domain-containing protein [Solirubrobacterales bacterium]|nr:DUF418 domain-containing protein [Solirubrobacterales bacterium]